MRLSHRVGWVLAAAVVVWAWPSRSPLAAETEKAEKSEVRPETEMRQRLDRASALFEQGKFQEARGEYDKATKQDPGNIRAWVGLGWSHWQLGDHAQALKIWNDILKVKPGDPKILLALGQAHEANKNWNEALGYYERLLKAGAETRESHFGKARVLEQMARYPAAEEELKIVLKQTPDDVNAQFTLARIYLAQKKRPEAEAILKKLAAHSPEPKYLRILGDGMLALGRYDEAEDYYKRSLVREPDHRGTVLSLSRAYARDHRYDESVDTLKTYVGRHPEDEQAREELAKAAANANNLAEAEIQFRYLIQKHPDDDQWPMRLAKMYRLAGKSDQGVAVARDVLKRDPKDVDALGFLADDAQLSGKDDEGIKLLEQLASVQPIPSRLNQLGRLRMTRAERLMDEDRTEAAKADYRAAQQAFGVSAKLDPTESDAALGIVAALRLSGEEDQAAAEAERYIREHPNLESMRLEAYQTYSQTGRYEDAERHLRELIKEYPNNIGLEQQLAMLDFNEGQREDGIQRLEQMLKKPLKNRVPILLYHGVSRSPRTPSAMPAENFRDQMTALKKNGYQAITLDQFIAFTEGKSAGLPPKPVLITFDDARADTIEFADPVLEQLGFHAAMFIPAGEIGQHGAYYAPWHQLNDLFKTGRWDMQCHANLGHRTVPIDAQGHEGRFFTDRMWLADQNRLETEQEFAQRIEEDYRSCREVIEQKIPGEKVVGYAYPFGDFGQRRFTNEPKAIPLNIQYVRKYYRAAFVEAPFGMATPTTSRERYPRYEMALDSNGEDLLRLLRTADPENSTLYLLAQLYSWSGRFADANEIYDHLETHGYDRATVLTAKAQALQWNGDYSGARKLFREAAALKPQDHAIQRKVSNLDLQVAPTLIGEGDYYADNRDRTNFSIGPGGKAYLTDRFSIAAKYQYREFEHDKFNLSTLAAPSTTSSPTLPPSLEPPSNPAPATTTSPLTQLPAGTTGRAKFRAVGNQVEGQAEYQIDQRTAFSIGGGVAEFKDRSSQKLLEGDQTFPLASGRLSFGLSDYSDVAIGGSHGYVPSAGTILEGLEYSGGQVQVRVHPIETWTIFGQGIGEVYDGGNNRISALGRITKLIWSDPGIELGYQFLYDDAKEENPFFYTPNQFIGNEAVGSIKLGDGKPFKLELAGSIGEGSEKNGNAEVEGSVSGALTVQLSDHFSLLAGGGRTQSARFSSVEGRGSIVVKF